MSEKNKKKKLTKRKRQRYKIIGLIVLVILIFILLIAAFALSKWNKLDKIAISKKDVEVNDLTEETAKSMKGYTTIALFGLDNRSNGNFESGNSDTIIVVSINNDSGEIKMASVYRDTFLDIGDDSFNKANAAYNRGGPKQAINMLNRNLDLNITDYVSVDFNAVVDVVDAVGGIELDITEEEAHYINGYIDEIMDVTGKSSSHVSAGTQTVDGVQATAYARIRYTSGWDFKRTERQRTVIAKTFEKAKQVNLATLNSLVDVILPEVSTSLSIPEILGLAKNVTKYNMGENTGFPFETHTVDVGKITYAEAAVDFEANVTELHKFLFSSENYTPSATVKELSETLKSLTGY